MLRKTTLLLTAAGSLLLSSFAEAEPKVRLSTSMGDIVLDLNTEQAPNTVANFLQYVEEGFYDGTQFHRIVPGFVIQGGGFDSDFNRKATRAPIENEATNGLANSRGTIAMARTRDPHSASSQFFINLRDNMMLNHTQPAGQGWGYAVFGEVIEGMDVVDEISKAKLKPNSEIPATPIILEQATIIEE